MSKAPSMPLFVDAYIADTMHLTPDEDGVYMRLLMCMWRNDGSLPDTDDRLARFARVTKSRWVKKYRPVLIPFFEVSDGFLTQKRLTKEWQHVAEKIAKNSANGAKGGRPKSLNNNETTKANGLVPEKRTDTETKTQSISTHTHTHKEEKEQPDGCSKKSAVDLLEIPDFLKRTPPPTTPAANDKHRGNSLATDWELPTDWADWAATQLGWNADEINRTAFRFKNHWLSTPGAKGRKSNWRRTWENWCTSGLPDVRGNGARGRVGDHGGTLTAARLVSDKDRAAVSPGQKIRF
jgi:uncharacterized protein YdaU (DUF1376 family)